MTDLSERGRENWRRSSFYSAGNGDTRARPASPEGTNFFFKKKKKKIWSHNIFTFWFNACVSSAGPEDRTVLARPGVRLPGRIRKTGHVASRATRSATLPIRKRSSPSGRALRAQSDRNFILWAAATISSRRPSNPGLQVTLKHSWNTRCQPEMATVYPLFLQCLIQIARLFPTDIEPAVVSGHDMDKRQVSS